MNIALIGFMGTGKSTVAQYIHKVLKLEVVEMDALIAEREHCTIEEIFSKKGETYFRDLETELLRELQCKENVVISCGGGVPLRTKNVELMKKNGTIIMLTASPETILQRVYKDDSRPLLKDKKDPEAIREMMEVRDKVYKEAADMIISVDQKSVEQIFEEIQEKLRKMEMNHV